MRQFTPTCIAALGFCLAISGAALAQSRPSCSDQPGQSITIVDVPGNPFQALPTSDGCWVFVSLPSTTLAFPSGVGLMKRFGGRLTLERVVPVPGNATGMTLTHDDKMLIVAAGRRVAFVDAHAFIAGRRNPVLGYLDE